MDDLRLDSNGDLYFEDYDISPTDSLAQRIYIHLKWFLGESVFYPDFGVDYFGKMFVKNPDETDILMMFSQELGKIDGVKRVGDMDIEIDNEHRRAIVKYEVITDRETVEDEIEIWLTE